MRACHSIESTAHFTIALGLGERWKVSDIGSSQKGGNQFDPSPLRDEEIRPRHYNLSTQFGREPIFRAAYSLATTLLEMNNVNF